jgi:hypothetical protein
MLFEDILAAAKLLCSEKTNKNDDFLTQEIEFGQEDFCRELNLPFMETRGSLSSVAYKYIYDLPDNFDTIKSAIYEQDHILTPRNEAQWSQFLRSDSYGTPRFYIIKEGKLQVYPATDTTAETTTLSAAITTTTQTTITLTSVTGLEMKGRGLIDSEVIEWQYINSSKQLLNCRRGLEGTEAAAHLNGATFTYRNIEFDYYKTPNTTYLDAAEPIIPARYHEALILYAAYKFFEKEENEAKANGLLAKYTVIKNQAKSDLGEKQSQTFTTTLEDDVGSGQFRDETYPQNSSLTAP